MLSRARNKWNKQVVLEQLLEFNMHFHGTIHSKTFLLERNSGAFGNRLAWTSCKDKPTSKAKTCKAVFFNPGTLTKLLLLCFMRRVPSHAAAENWCYFEQY